MDEKIKGGLKGFIIGSLILSVIFIITYIPNVYSVNEEKNEKYLTFSDCRDCSLVEKSYAECAWEVMGKNSNGRFADVENYKEDYEETVASRISEVKQLCSQRNTNDARFNPQLFGIDHPDANFNFSLNEVCNNPESIMREISEEALYKYIICDEGSFVTTIFDSNNRKMAKGNKPTFITTFFNKITFDNYKDTSRNIGAYFIGPLWFAIYLVIWLLPLEGAIVGVIKAQKVRELSKPSFDN